MSNGFEIGGFEGVSRVGVEVKNSFGPYGNSYHPGGTNIKTTYNGVMWKLCFILGDKYIVSNIENSKY